MVPKGTTWFVWPLGFKKIATCVQYKNQKLNCKLGRLRPPPSLFKNKILSVYKAMPPRVKKSKILVVFFILRGLWSGMELLVQLFSVFVGGGLKQKTPFLGSEGVKIEMFYSGECGKVGIKAKNWGFGG